MRVLIAPDSFKGSATAGEVANAIAEGWAAVRPGDKMVCLPQGDGGEGTLDAVAAAPGSHREPDKPHRPHTESRRQHDDSGQPAQWRWRHTDVDGPDGRPVRARWLFDQDAKRAVIELAEASGIALLDRLDPWRADTRGLGQVIRTALAAGADQLQIGLGSSASTDGGAGALLALGLRAYDPSGQPIAPGANGLRAVTEVDASQLTEPPPGGAELLTDTSATLTGPRGAAALFGPQKGATPADIETLDDALAHWAQILDRAGLTADPKTPGAGAAGGTGFGLIAWGAVPTSGAARVAALTGLDAQIETADLVITGEGRYDETSKTGKLVNHVLSTADRHAVPALLIAGDVAAACPAPAISLTDLAGSPQAALAEPLRWLRAAGSAAAQSTGSNRSSSNGVTRER